MKSGPQNPIQPKKQCQVNQGQCYHFSEWTLDSSYQLFFRQILEKKKNTIPKCLFPKYFSVSEFVDGKITAQCNLCARSNVLKFVRSYGTVTSNLLAHMKVSLEIRMNTFVSNPHTLSLISHPFREDTHMSTKSTEKETMSHRWTFIIRRRKPKRFSHHPYNPRKVSSN